ncbi:hypothetical protein MRX96_004847 [Rhipicephalus microplus]
MTACIVVSVTSPTAPLRGARADLPPPTSGGIAAPAFLHEPPVQVVFSNMTGALVSCSASGQPRPVISWTNESGSPIDHIPGLRRGRPDGTLEFFPFRGEDYRQEVHASRYRCRASNTLGSVFSRSVHVKAAALANTGSDGLSGHADLAICRLRRRLPWLLRPLARHGFPSHAVVRSASATCSSVISRCILKRAGCNAE